MPETLPEDWEKARKDCKRCGGVGSYLQHETYHGGWIKVTCEDCKGSGEESLKGEGNAERSDLRDD